MIFDPTVRGSRVDFRFCFPRGAAPSVKTFHVEYVGIDLDDVPLMVHYNTALGLILQALSQDDIYVVATESAVPEEMAEFWARYFDIEVLFTEVAGELGSLVDGQPSQPSTVGVTFGGGKDSAFAVNLLSSLLGPENVLAISFTHPDKHLSISALRRRRQVQVLDRLPFLASQRYCEVLTDVRHVIGGFHTELYFAPLGVFLYLGMVDALTLSYEFCHYHRIEPGELYFRRSRPEMLSLMSEYFSRLAKRRIWIFNSNQAVTELSSFGYLVTTSPGTIQTITMCESTADPEIRWCERCTKCGEFVLMSAFFGIEQDQIDPDQFFAESGWAEKVRNELAQGGTGHVAATCTPRHVESFAFLMEKLDAADLGLHSSKATELLRQLRKRYAGLGTTAPDGFYPELLPEAYPGELAVRAVRELSTVLPSYEAPPQIRIGNETLPIVFAHEVEQLRHPVTPGSRSARTLFDVVPTRDIFASDQAGAEARLSVRPEGGLATADLHVGIYRDAAVVSTSVSGPTKDSGYSIIIDLDRSSDWVSFTMALPRIGEGQFRRFRFILEADGVSQLPDDWEPARRSTVYVPPGAGRVCVGMVAREDLPPWNWGRPMTLVVEAFRAVKDPSPTKGAFAWIEQGWVVER